MQYLDYINSDNFASDERAMDVFRSGEYVALGPLFQRVFCVPASSCRENILTEWTDNEAASSKDVGYSVRSTGLSKV